MVILTYDPRAHPQLRGFSPFHPVLPNRQTPSFLAQARPVLRFRLGICHGTFRFRSRCRSGIRRAVCPAVFHPHRHCRMVLQGLGRHLLPPGNAPAPRSPPGIPRPLLRHGRDQHILYGPLKPELAKLWSMRVAAVNPRFLFTAKLYRAFTHSPVAVMEPTSAATIRPTDEDEI